MDDTPLYGLSACDVAGMIRRGALGAEEYVQACIERIMAGEQRLQAWAYFDAEDALAQARELDRWRASGAAVGPLHGVPVGLKDVIDTAGMPTENGTVLHAGRVPMHDAAVVTRLRAAGAVIMGKTVTTELATYTPGKTRNPHNPEHSPGGSSSGSAAAVAAGMVPLALGTQTNGSLIRPAAYCGVFGFKPSYGLIGRSGVLVQSPALDLFGVMARSLEDAALMSETLVGYDAADNATRPQPRPRLLQVCAEAPPLPPLLAFVPTPMWHEAAPDTQAAIAELIEHLGDRIATVDVPDGVAQAWSMHRTIMEAEMAFSFEREYHSGRDRLSVSLRQQIERGRGIAAVDYRRALAAVAGIHQVFEDMLQSCDAILTPAATGTAPHGLESTGSPVFCTPWTLCGMPAISLPLLRGENGLPLGVQLVGRRGDDARLLRTARWLWSHVVGAGAVVMPV